jgi:hypothetical protein
MPTDVEEPYVFIGCDPGRKGGLAAIDADGNFLFAERIPQKEVESRTPRKKTKSGKVRAPRMEVDVDALAAMVDQLLLLPGRKVALIERVWPRPFEGVISSFTFGGAYFAIRQALASAKIPRKKVLPADWQKDMIPKGVGKDQAARKKIYLKLARKKFKKAKLDREGDDDVAAALLIAEFYRTCGVI